MEQQAAADPGPARDLVDRQVLHRLHVERDAFDVREPPLQPPDHLHRVRVVGGLKGNESGEVSCSTCHAAFFPTVDRATPRTTCASCHNGRAKPVRTPPVLIGGQPAARVGDKLTCLGPPDTVAAGEPTGVQDALTTGPSVVRRPAPRMLP